MKKLLIPIILIILSISLISCSNEETGQPFDPMESSIFQMAEVQNCRVLEKLEVRTGASEGYSTIAVLNPGEVVRVLGKIDDWYVVRLENYRVGCIDSSKTEPVVKDNRQPQTPTPTQPEQPDRNADDEPDQQPNLPDQPEEPGIPGQPADPTPDEPETVPEPNPVESEPPEQPGERQPAETPAENVDRTQESQLINLVNQERRKNGLPALSSDLELTRVARIKAQDMIDNDYFSHYSPTYGSPFDMMKQFGIDYQYAGENLAHNTSVDRAHTALMNSSGHRKNILSPNFTHIGIGIKKAERGYIYVEMFIGVPR
ncbi:MAG: CAP domain-containing protein [Halanaerobiales bacterium]